MEHGAYRPSFIRPFPQLTSLQRFCRKINRATSLHEVFQVKFESRYSEGPYHDTYGAPADRLTETRLIPLVMDCLDRKHRLPMIPLDLSRLEEHLPESTLKPADRRSSRSTSRRASSMSRASASTRRSPAPRRSSSRFTPQAPDNSSEEEEEVPRSRSHAKSGTPTSGRAPFFVSVHRDEGPLRRSGSRRSRSSSLSDESSGGEDGHRQPVSPSRFSSHIKEKKGRVSFDPRDVTPAAFDYGPDNGKSEILSFDSPHREVADQTFRDLVPLTPVSASSASTRRRNRRNV